MIQNDSRETWPEGDLLTWRLMDLVFLPMMISVGLIGNCLVMYIYTFRMRRSTVTLIKRMLAALDLTSLLCVQPLLLYMVFYPEFQLFNITCRSVCALAVSTAVASSFVFAFIAIDRYMRFYQLRPRGIDPQLVRKLFVATVVFSVAINVPGFWVFSKSVNYYPNYRIKLTRCYINMDTVNKIVLSVYSIYLSVMFVCFQMLYVCLYSRMAQALQCLCIAQDRQGAFRMYNPENPDNPLGPALSRRAHDVVKNSIHVFRLITFVYFNCNAIYYITLAFQLLHKETDGLMTPLLQAVVDFGRYVPLFGNMVNPIIYSCTSPSFRQEVYKLALFRICRKHA